MPREHVAGGVTWSRGGQRGHPADVAGGRSPGWSRRVQATETKPVRSWEQDRCFPLTCPLAGTWSSVASLSLARAPLRVVGDAPTQLHVGLGAPARGAGAPPTSPGLCSDPSDRSARGGQGTWSVADGHTPD